MPDTILDIFNGDAFSAVALTASVNMVPNAYGRVNALGLFAPEPIPTTTVIVSIENGVLNLLPTRPRGGPASLGTPERRAAKAFVVPHIPHDDSVLATDVQNLVARAPNAGLETVLGEVNRKLTRARRKHAITLEHMRLTALRGTLLDYDGTVLINYFTDFGVPEKVVDFVLGTAATNIAGKCHEVSGHIEDNLMGDTMTGVHALASPSWFAKFIAHKEVKEAYQFYVSITENNPLRNDVRKGFTFQNITFEEYRGSATKLNEDKTTTVQRFIPDGDVRFFPVGTTETFTNYWAPPDFIDAVNVAPDVAAEAEVFVAPLEPMKFGKGMDMHTESNPLPLVKRPALLVRGHSSN
jgi:hypothetical protein